MTARRATPPGARGEPAVWLMGGALVVCLALIAGMLALILWQGGRTFWPREIERIELESGEVLLGQPMAAEPFTTPDGRRTTRLRVRVGNRVLGQDTARGLLLTDIAARSRPAWPTLVERVELGRFFGRVEALVTLDEAGGEAERIEGERAWAELPEALEAGRSRRAEIERIERSALRSIAERLESIRYRERSVERRAELDPADERSMPIWGFAVVCVAGAAAAAGLVRTRRAGLRWALLAAVVMAGSAAWLEHPWSGRALGDQAASERLDELGSLRRDLEARRAELTERLASLRAEDERHRLVLREAGPEGRISPRSETRPDEPMLVSQALRAVRINETGLGDRLALYGARWWGFLSRSPSATPGSGGVFEVIVGTVTLTLLLVVGVVPLGVLTALYMREYAKQGPLTSAVRIAINNLAGVPSIVYGMFGLGFFCYVLGGYIDAGPGETALPRGSWWGLLAVFAGLLCAAGATAAWAARPGRGRLLGGLSGLLWAGAAAALLAALWTTPYFGGFFSSRLPEQPTFGSRGILWASLTLALLTLPVVIVATEEAIAAVPGSMREGSFGCGASRWQTIRRIVLPSAMPGVMTGAILAMARGAGEVAPLMLVGAVNLAPGSPVSGEPPFLHGERTFMHLGFHIYNLGFQAPNVEATLPLVWTTTLLLIMIVVTLNVVAVWLRARFRKGLTSSAL